MTLDDITIEPARDGDLAEILRTFERFWGDRQFPRNLHHPIFFCEFGDTAFVARRATAGGAQVAGYLLGFVAISVGWFLVHTVYTFRYAHLYWHDPAGGDACGGIRFPGTDEPSDYDFAYFSFTLGTSFAVSDPQVTETRVRREVMVHSIISFAYNSVIIGMVINLFAGIFSALAGTGK